MKITVSLGSSPWGETCVQVGQQDYATRAMRECEAFRAQLVRVYLAAFGSALPNGAAVKVMQCPHDFGTYFEVHGVFEDTDTEAGDAVMWLEDNSPEVWDGEARQELGFSAEGA